MKTYLPLSLLCFILFSCSTIKLENKIVKDFLNEKYKNEKDVKMIFLIDQSLIRNRAMETYEEVYNKRDLNYYLSNNLKEKDYWPINSKGIAILKAKYKLDTIPYYWKKTDFDQLHIPIMEYNKQFQESEIDQHLKHLSKGYKISRPLLFSNNKYALLDFYSYTIIFGDSSARGVYVLEKKDGKWVVINEYFDGIYN
jgi:hypothetical protein